MRLHSLSALLGIATVAIVAIAPVQAAPSIYQVNSGVTSLQFDKPSLAALALLGLTFDSAFDTVPPAAGFGLGFAIDPTTTDLTFSYDLTTQAFAPVSGAAGHLGGISFIVEPKLEYPSSLNVGDFSVGFDDQGFFLRDTLTTGLRLFDIVPTGNLTLTDSTLTVSEFDVKVAQQFNDSLSYATLEGTDLGLTGFKLGTGTTRLVSKKVPEPGVMLGLLAVTATALAAKRR